VQHTINKNHLEKMIIHHVILLTIINKLYGAKAILVSDIIIALRVL